VVIFERVTLRPRQVTLHGLTAAPPKQTDLRSGRWNGQTCQLEVLPPDTRAHIPDRGIGWYLHLAVFIRDHEADGGERQIVRALLGGGGS
jgi:hypothetical protein